jgi:bifunctional dethiobiotin synthetase / adenosylmethionine---8-amino-7-oxononanoate aminotransferase
LADGVPGHCGILTARDIIVNTGYQSHSAHAVLKALGDAVGGTNLDMSCGPGGAPFSVHYRTLGDIAYFMTSLNTPPSTIRAVEDRIWALLEK